MTLDDCGSSPKSEDSNDEDFVIVKKSRTNKTSSKNDASSTITKSIPNSEPDYEQDKAEGSETTYGTTEDELSHLVEKKLSLEKQISELEKEIEELEKEQIQADPQDAPNYCIPIKANVMDFEWERLANACQFDAIVMDPPWQLASQAPTRG
ncbi:hypothetical protein BB560_006053, partial [Smittium megazygosporum]